MLRIIKFYIPFYFPIDTFIKTKMPFLIGKLLRCLLPIPCVNYSNEKDIPQEREKLIEWAIMDTFDALGAKYECGSMVGSGKYSDLCVFSFHTVKIIAGGEGGMITTNSDDLYKKLKFTSKYLHDEKGFDATWFNMGLSYKYEKMSFGLFFRQI